ncbi:MAG TPA: FliM/FliN family flagellar motor switch protein, partial [Candidatus Acidoferrum sp.]|nr:FliM/FliN family flagellar motor switch protein [Candidatus Acidoferrum sp.]
GQQLTDFQWSPTVVAGRGMTEEDIQQLTRNVERAGVEIEVELGQTMVSLRDLVTLREGDVVVFDKLTNEPLSARVNEKEKFRVFPGINKDQLTVQVSHVLASEDE